MRLTIVQYGGDYREAWERFESGGKATYQAQQYSINFVAGLAARLDQVTIVCAVTPEAYDVVLPNRVRAIGAGLKNGFRPQQIVPVAAETAPDRLVLVTPLVPLLRWARRDRIRTLATLADSFPKRGLRDAIRNRVVAHELNSPNVEWIGNHGIAACLSLQSIGVREEKIVPWDWPPSHTPQGQKARTLDRSKPLRLVFVGSVCEEKGTGDILRALHQLKSEGLRPTLSIIGNDPEGRIEALAKQLRLEDQARFTGIIPNEDIPRAMRSADVVVIPSRHEYPEGLPLTIYEALAARTPIVASDHPMFRGALKDGENALIFRASDIGALAQALRRLGEDDAVYARLSANSQAAWEALQLPVRWGELLDRWLSGEAADREWIREHSLACGLYEQQISVRTAN